MLNNTFHRSLNPVQVNSFPCVKWCIKISVSVITIWYRFIATCKWSEGYLDARNYLYKKIEINFSIHAHYKIHLPGDRYFIGSSCSNVYIFWTEQIKIYKREDILLLCYRTESLVLWIHPLQFLHFWTENINMTYISHSSRKYFTNLSLFWFLPSNSKQPSLWCLQNNLHTESFKSDPHSEPTFS